MQRYHLEKLYIGHSKSHLLIFGMPLTHLSGWLAFIHKITRDVSGSLTIWLGNVCQLRYFDWIINTDLIDTAFAKVESFNIIAG